MSSNNDNDALSFTKVTLMDVQPLFGGYHVILLDDGEINLHAITPRKKIKNQKFRVKIKIAKLEELDELISNHNFPEISIEDRAGEPDEARPKIKVIYDSGEEVEKEKWANDEHPDFDPIYEWILKFAKALERGGKPYQKSEKVPEIF